jgi:predicted nucleic acid-binding protein
MNGEFLDTNILVYAHDCTAGKKCDVATELLLRLMISEKGMLSIQVLMEFYTTVTRKIPNPLDSETAAGIIEDLLTWAIYSPKPSMCYRPSF